MTKIGKFLQGRLLGNCWLIAATKTAPGFLCNPSSWQLTPPTWIQTARGTKRTLLLNSWNKQHEYVCCIWYLVSLFVFLVSGQDNPTKVVFLFLVFVLALAPHWRAWEIGSQRMTPLSNSVSFKKWVKDQMLDMTSHRESFCQRVNPQVDCHYERRDGILWPWLAKILWKENPSQSFLSTTMTMPRL